MSKGFCIPEEGHVVQVIVPWGSNAATKAGTPFSMENYAHCDIILSIGATGGAASFILYEATDITVGTKTAIAAKVYKEETQDGDTLSAGVALATTGLATANTADIMYVISVDAQQLTDGYPYLHLAMADLDNTTYVSAVAILSGARYAGPESATAIL